MKKGEEKKNFEQKAKEHYGTHRRSGRYPWEPVDDSCLKEVFEKFFEKFAKEHPEQIIKIK